MSEKLCLIAAFDKFAGLDTNHSELVLDALPSTLDTSIKLQKILLPTCCIQSWETLSPYLETDFESLILTGASWGSVISLERFALNIRCYPVKDNGQHQWQDSRIDESAPDAFMTGLPLRELETSLREKDYFCEVSDHAGTFVCNEVYFRALQHKKQHKKTGSVVFVHLPPPGKFSSRVASHGANRGNISRLMLLLSSKERQLQLLAGAVLDIVRFSVNHSN